MQLEELCYPAYDKPLLQAYEGAYECAFVCLHPFVKFPDGIAGTLEDYPGPDLILRDGTKCAWSWIAAQTSLGTYAKVNHALLTSIMALKEEFSDHAAAERLYEFLSARSIWAPGEGRFEPLLQPDFKAIFQASGTQDVIFVPEFADVHTIVHFPIGKFERLSGEEFPSRGCLVPPDHRFLFTVDWDSFFTLFYGPRDFVTAIVQERMLEGFWLKPDHHHWWYRQTV